MSGVPGGSVPKAIPWPPIRERQNASAARASPWRRISAPWLGEAIGTAEWTGTPLRGVLEDAGLNDEAAEIVFTGLDRGIEGHVVQPYQRSLSLSDAIRAGKATFVEIGMDRAYTGAPAEATREEGEELYARLVTMVVTEITEGLAKRAPV